ncbi:MAG: phosphatidate cytidylyltransferase [Gemmatimonadetes bacterium]|nr:phosphatidate cytidylyltransferase [Gemmatimonadota bacterium]
MSGDLARRVAVAAVGIPFGVWVIYLGGWPLGAVIGAIAAGSAHEFYGLARARGAVPLVGLGVAAAGGIAAAPFLVPVDVVALPLWTLAVLLVPLVAAFAVFIRGVEGRPLEVLSVTVTGVLYTGGALSFAGLLRTTPGTSELGGALLLVFPLLVTWIGDTFAYFGGRAWGRRKLAPRVSPKKTVEGALAGLVGSALAGGLFTALALEPAGIGLSIAPGAVLAALLGAVGQVGDLAESVLKREAGVKDSGALLPGHGGLLDRFDAIFFTVPVFWVLFRVWSSL